MSPLALSSPGCKVCHSFKQWVKDREEGVFVLSLGLMGTLDQVIFEDGKRVGLTHDPEDLIFKP